MADFNLAHDRVVKGKEGGWVDDPLDPGAETYKGRSRRFHPEFPGWSRIDAMKGRGDFPACLEEDAVLQGQVREAYRTGEWMAIQGDAIPDQIVADEMMDQAILEGPGAAVHLLQFALNALNKGGVSWRDIPVDGRFGPMTLGAVRSCSSKGRSEKLAKTLNILQGVYLLLGKDVLEFLKDHPTPAWRERFWPGGWLDRVSIG